ncbi:MAG: NAD(P)/FAD-dependent oxidoreductase [Sarcina sp.]
MTIRINNISLSIDEDVSLIKNKVAKKLNLPLSEIKEIKIVKESIDARKKSMIKFNYCVDIEHDNESKIVAKINDRDVKIETLVVDELTQGNEHLNHRPIVVGLGPAGLFAALLLARKGYKPLVFERGEDVDSRTKTVEKFWKTGILNTESNVQFGEGGAGAFSDGKLTTRIKDTRCDFVLEALVKGGAPEEILYKGKPHVGTDILKDVVKNVREEIRALGGEVRFNSKFEGILKNNSKLKGIIVNGEEVPCEVLILALGHSSRDTYEMLFNERIFMAQKPFAIGVRVEQPQKLINISQYGEKYANHPKLKAAEYRLTYQSKTLERAVYSFCMCPGGVVVNASSEEGRLCVNGMSYNDRDKENANSAIVVAVGPKDFEGSHPLAGMEFQRHYEELAYELGGKNYSAPVQLVGDFMNDKVSTKLGKVKPSVLSNGYEFKSLNKCLPSYVINGLKEGLVDFDRKIKGFADYDSILTGIETRTSAPVRIERNERLQSISLEGLYPAGEGAGFAGGIVSAAVDGLKVAESIIKKYKIT